MIIYGIMGQIGSGKTYYTNKIVEESKMYGRDVAIMSFAQPFKKFLYDNFGISKEKVNDYMLSLLKFNIEREYEYVLNNIISNEKNSMLNSIFYNNIDSKESKIVIDKIVKTLLSYDENNKTEFYKNNRDLMQYFGSEYRLGLNLPHIWIKFIDIKIQKLIENKSVDVIIVDDLRFSYEFDYINHLRINDNSDVKFKYITAHEHIRAIRRNIDVETIRKMDLHISELDSKDLCIKYPNLIEQVENNG